MTDLQIILQASIRTIKYFPLVLPTVIIGLAVLTVEEKEGKEMLEKRHIIFEKNAYIANILLKTGRCKNEGNWIFSCKDNVEDMKILQEAVYAKEKEIGAKIKLLFANPDDYGDLRGV